MYIEKLNHCVCVCVCVLGFYRRVSIRYHYLVWGPTFKRHHPENVTQFQTCGYPPDTHLGDN